MKKIIGLMSVSLLLNIHAYAEDVASSINCQYHIAEGTQQIDPTLITKWAENATLQAFDYDFNTVDKSLDSLKSCFTDEGWVSYSEALKKSGNIEAVKAQHLAVSAMNMGNSNFQTIKENQWKLSLPLQVVYQNTEEKLTQQLNVDVLVGRKPNGDLGILQMVATPNKTDTAVNATATQLPAQTTPTQTMESTQPDTTNQNNTVTPTTPNTMPAEPTQPQVPATAESQPATTAPATTPAATTENPALLQNTAPVQNTTPAQTPTTTDSMAPQQ